MRVLYSIVFLFVLSYGLQAQSAVGDIESKIASYKSRATFVPLNRSQFINALEQAKPFDIIYVKGNVEINLSGLKSLSIKEGVKLIGDRDPANGRTGAKLYTTSSGVHPLFNVAGDNVLIAGLVIKGDDGDVLRGTDAFAGKSAKYKKENYLKLYNKNMYSTPVSSGIATKSKNLMIYNCELSHWTYTAVYIQKGALNAQIVNSFVHHNQRFGLGYGVTIDQGEAYILNNTFNFNRHSIASTGRAGSRYTAENNTFHKEGNNSWAVDMHGGRDRNDGTNLAGEYIVVRNNIFYLSGKGQAVVIRGTPSASSLIENNTIVRDQSSVIPENRVFEQVNSKGNVKFKNNRFK